MEQTTLIQCDCHGWMSPRAVFCPTCGAPGPGGGDVEKRPNPGWQIVNLFWTAVFIALVVGVVLT